jgi:hypothetical protein
MLLKYWHVNNTLSGKKYGLQIKLTPENAMYKLNEILNALKNKLIVGSIFCDVEKAFDCVMTYCYQK